MERRRIVRSVSMPGDSAGTVEVAWSPAGCCTADVQMPIVPEMVITREAM